jgi:hypothetical protein
MAKKKRVINTGPKSVPAQARRELYGHAISRVNNAIENRYPLEAIALLESMIADRLEARLACLHQQSPEKRNLSTLGNLTQELSGKKLGESDEAKVIYQEVNDWADRRNEALHEMVKLAEGSEKDWEEKVGEAQATAEKGLTLFRKLDELVRELNKPPKSATKAPQPEN